MTALHVHQGSSLPNYSRRGRAVSLIVLHESVTRTRKGCVKVLKRRGLGVHYTVDRDGSVHQHAPLIQAAAHAGRGRNRNSIAVEVVNRYYGAKAVEGETVIKAVWAHKGRYILPTDAQLRATWATVNGLLQLTRIEPSFPGATGDRFHWGRAAEAYSGVAAHHRWAHADGLVPEHYCWLRSRGWDHETAWTDTLTAAQSGRRVTEARNG